MSFWISQDELIGKMLDIYGDKFDIANTMGGYLPYFFIPSRSGFMMHSFHELPDTIKEAVVKRYFEILNTQQHEELR